MINSDSNSKVFSKRFANRSIENSKAWFSYGSFKIRHFWEYHSSGGICGWNGRLYALSGCGIDLFLCLDVIEINDFISVKMQNRNCVSAWEWNSRQDVKYTSCGVIGWNERWNGLSGCETNMVHWYTMSIAACIYEKGFMFSVYVWIRNDKSCILCHIQFHFNLKIFIFVSKNCTYSQFALISIS